MKIGLVKKLFAALAFLKLDKFADKVYWNYFHGFKPASYATLEAIEKAFLDTNRTGVLKKGDYYEFGVFKGYSLYYAQMLSSRYYPQMNIYGFDSFEGIPELKEGDQKKEFYPGQFAVSKENVIRNIKRKGGDIKKIKLIKGFFYDSLNKKTKKKYIMKKASIINLDSDLYSSAVDVLKFCKTLLMKDTVILFDDWNSFSGEKPSGEERAFEEFLRTNKSIKVKKMFAYGWHGQAFKVVSI
ncbi:MAG: TylF/MycF/NovP-related O-methyltransferase [Candidatus Levybacteria bacterium]|nr:TylF/MycF/NovP-related O-methyltransferase [Candidatus Levybacteria bacterium]